jgi:N-acetyl-anhydromuramyl-L-alanine amidase AmpD
MSSFIIVGGEHVPLVLPDEQPPRVLTWIEHRVRFKAGQGANKERKRAINLCVWHWTGGENEPLVMVETLKARELGIEFAISRIGEIYQFCDPLLVDTADAGSVNPRSVGVEIVNFGMTRPTPGWTIPKRGADRGLREVFIHGVVCQTAEFYPAQIRAAMHLADALSRALPIRRKVPMSLQDPGAVLAKVMTPDTLSAFSGHVGHYHLTRDKCDPGPRFMAELGRLFHGATEPTA